MGGKVVVSTSTSVKKEVQIQPDGTQVSKTTTVTVEKYSDGTESTSTDVKTQTEKSNPNGTITSGVVVATQLGIPKPSTVPVQGGSVPARKSVAGGSHSRKSKVQISTGKTDEKFIQDALQAHNDLRARHSSPPLVIDTELNNSAQQWADKIAAQQKMSHSTTDLGENVYWSTKTNLDGNVPVESWYGEIKDFNFAKMEPQKGTGHFTQVIWKGSKRLGIAKAVHPQGGTFVVAHYDPAGNFIGHYGENISRAK